MISRITYNTVNCDSVTTTSVRPSTQTALVPNTSITPTPGCMNIYINPNTTPNLSIITVDGIKHDFSAGVVNRISTTLANTEIVSDSSVTTFSNKTFNTGNTINANLIYDKPVNLSGRMLGSRIKYDGTTWIAEPTIASFALMPAWLFRDTKSIGTPGGSSIIGVQTRIIALDVANSSTDTSITNPTTTTIQINAISRYLVHGYSVAAGTTGMVHKAQLTNSAGTTTFLEGTSARVYTGNSQSTILGVINITAVPTTLILRHYTNTAIATTGLGLPSNIGENEIYTQLYIRKLY